MPQAEVRRSFTLRLTSSIACSSDSDGLSRRIAQSFRQHVRVPRRRGVSIAVVVNRTPEQFEGISSLISRQTCDHSLNGHKYFSSQFIVTTTITDTFGLVVASGKIVATDKLRLKQNPIVRFVREILLWWCNLFRFSQSDEQLDCNQYPVRSVSQVCSQSS